MNGPNDQTLSKQLLINGLTGLRLNTNPDMLLHYLTLLAKWNQHYNLTAIRDFDAMITRHILDSLAIAHWVKKKQVLDVGSGAGFPGIPLAINDPNLFIVLLDSNGKKINFLHEVKRHLAIRNIEIIQTRVESYHPSFGFDTVISRAFSNLQCMVNWTRHLINRDGNWLAMKGRVPEAELTNINLAYQTKPYSVPGLDGERCCIIIENSTKD